MNKFKTAKSELLNLNDLPIYIAGHLKPDQDSIGSCLAVAEFLKKNGKTVFVLLEEKDNDIISLKGDYSLIVSKVSHAKYNFIALDLNEKKRLGSFEKDFDGAEYKINIDHHQDNKYEADFTLSIPGISSTCEIIFEIIKTEGRSAFTKTICEYLYAGILNDTNCFTRRLSSKTMAIAQRLINFKIDYVKIIKKTFSERTLYEFQALAKLVDGIKYDGFHYVVVDKKDPAFEKLTHNQIVKKLAEDLRQIEGFDVFLVLIKQEDTIVAKVMSNVSEIADKLAAVFGGGGHKKEAGFTIKNVAVEEIIKSAKKFLNK